MSRLGPVAGGQEGWYERLAPLRALGVANARYWPSVAPVAGRQLARWRVPAAAIGDQRLRRLALEKLEHEAFNAQVAATLATLAPAASRSRSVEAIVALEVLFDYLDGRTENPGTDVLARGEVLFGTFRGALTVGPPAAREAAPDGGGDDDDSDYLQSLGGYVRERFGALPAASAVSGVASAALARCAEGQTRIHAVELLGVDQLRAWSEETGRGSGLGWREYAAGSASSVLAGHALIAAAADPSTTALDADRIDAAYLAMGAAITILDSVVDVDEDRAHGTPGFVSLYEPDELGETLPALVRETLARTAEAPNAAHHAMTLAGVIAYYTSHPGARLGQASEIARRVRAELSPTVWPALSVMYAWRAAKTVRRTIRASEGNIGGRASGASSAGGA